MATQHYVRYCSKTWSRVFHMSVGMFLFLSLVFLFSVTTVGIWLLWPAQAYSTTHYRVRRHSPHVYHAVKLNYWNVWFHINKASEQICSWASSTSLLSSDRWQLSPVSVCMMQRDACTFYWMWIPDRIHVVLTDSGYKLWFWKLLLWTDKTLCALLI